MRKVKILIPIPELDNSYKKRLIDGIRETLTANTELFTQGVLFFGGLNVEDKKRQMMYEINIYQFVNNLGISGVIWELSNNTSLKYAKYYNDVLTMSDEVIQGGYVAQSQEILNHLTDDEYEEFVNRKS